MMRPAPVDGVGFFVDLENGLHKFGFIRKLVQTLGTCLHNQAVISKLVQTIQRFENLVY